MKAILLAAGRGSRMGERTRDLPKCLAPLCGRTLLEWQLDAFAAAGIRDLAVVRGYRAETLEGAFATVDNPRWSESNMVVSLTCARERLLAGPCLVSYSDIVVHPSHIARLAACQADIAISYDTKWHALWSLRFEDPLSDAETFRERDGWLEVIGGKTRDPADIAGQYMGLLRFSPAGWERVEGYLGSLPQAEIDRLDMTGLLARLLARGERIACVPIEGRWCEADNQDDLHRYEDAIAKADREGTRWSHDWRNG